MIDGYADQVSAFPGETVTFHVATDAPQFRIDFYRQGAVFESTGISTAWFAGAPGDPHEADQDWGEAATRRDGKVVDGWQGFVFAIPDDWQSGVYIAMFVEGDGNDNPNPNQDPPLDRGTPDARSGKALFVVKNPSPGVVSQLLYKVPLFTYQMYNMSQYDGIDGQVHAGAGYPFHNYHTNEDVGGLWVTLHRPGGGTGSTPWDSVYFGPLDEHGIPTGNLDPLDLHTYRQTFVHWDAKMISWLEGNGYRVDYCTDMDVHLDTDLALLSPYSLVLSVGHDEYYSTHMRDNLEAYIANGGNIAFFSGNTSYWRLIFPVQGSLLNITRDAQWDTTGRPENSLTGVRFDNAGERNYPIPNNDRENVGYEVQHVDLWPFEGTGLNENDTFAKDECIIGYECDGANFNRSAPRPVNPTGDDGTPDNFIILGIGDTTPWPPPWGYVLGNAAATMGMYTKNGTAFTGATTDWPRVVWQGESHTVQITKNVLNRLGGNPKGQAALSTLNNVIACDGFFSGDDNYRHAIVATADGAITEIFFSPNTGTGQTVLATQPGLLDVGSFYTHDDQYRHVITATGDGNIWEIFYSPQTGLGQALLGNIPNAERVAGFFSGDDDYRHAIVATHDGAVLEIFFNPTRGQGQVLLGTFSNVVDVGAFYSPDDKYRHAIVGTADGNVTEIYFNPDAGTFQTVIANVPDLAKISAYYAANDKFFNRRVQVLTNGGRIHEIRYNPDFGIMRAVLFNTGGLIDIGSFYSADDNFRHALLATPEGDIQELFFNP